MKAPVIDLDVTTVAIIAVAAVVGIVLLNKLPKLPSAGEAWNGATDVAFQTADVAAGLYTGNNVITQTARTDAYQGAGWLGTLGAVADHGFGGGLSRFGEWLGGKTYDWTH